MTFFDLLCIISRNIFFCSWNSLKLKKSQPNWILFPMQYPPSRNCLIVYILHKKDRLNQMKWTSKSTNWPATLPIPYSYFEFFFSYTRWTMNIHYNKWWQLAQHVMRSSSTTSQDFLNLSFRSLICRDLWYCGFRRYIAIFDIAENCGCGEEPWQ